VVKPIDIIRSATTIGAQVVRQEGKLGCVKPGAFADLIVVDGNPLKRLDLLQGQGDHIPLIMQGGKLYKNALN
jgi:imidazolonepropionase-like amidohydrolase